jgi:hypothetical integral membrane protein (TIGR02206 family)
MGVTSTTVPMLSAGRDVFVDGPYYSVFLALFAVAAAALITLGRAHRRMPTSRRFARTFAVAILALHLAVQLAATVPRWDIAHGLPLHLSDLAGLAAAYALWSGRRWAFSLTYYWGLTLSPQALLTPVLLAPQSPHWAWLVDWVWHLLVVAAAIYLTWGLGMRPGWGGYRSAVATTACWAATVGVFNILAGTNYGYLNGKPARASLLDLLGPWPWYLLPEAAILLGAWALMTFPWTRSRGPSGGFSAEESPIPISNG